VPIAPTSFSAAAQELAADAGFDLCGVVPAAEPPAELEYFPEWIAAGRAGEMRYLESRNDAGELKRAALKNVAPWARSVIVCALNYNAAQPRSIDCKDSRRGWISRYAWFKDSGRDLATDYHDAVLSRLRRVEDALKQRFGEFESRSYVDTGPIVERVYAKQAGLGWLAKNTCLINQEKGSYLFLGVILTSVDLAPSLADSAPLNLPAADRCGSCTRCIDACPTQALTPYKMDATRCIAYLTIEKRGELPLEFREGIGNNVFGCDICQDVCPWNGAENTGRMPLPSRVPEFEARPELVNPPLEWLGRMSRDEFNAAFRHSPIKRAKFDGIRRNVAIAMGNSCDPHFLPLLEQLAVGSDSNLTEHARWAIERIKSAASA